MSDERDVTLGEMYRLLERIERKVDETNAYAHKQAHDIRDTLNVVSGNVALLKHEAKELKEDIAKVDGRVDRIYQQAAMLAAGVSSAIWAGLQLLTSWWKHP